MVFKLVIKIACIVSIFFSSCMFCGRIDNIVLRACIRSFLKCLYNRHLDFSKKYNDTSYPENEADSSPDFAKGYKAVCNNLDKYFDFLNKKHRIILKKRKKNRLHYEWDHFTMDNASVSCRVGNNEENINNILEQIKNKLKELIIFLRDIDLQKKELKVIKNKILCSIREEKKELISGGEQKRREKQKGLDRKILQMIALPPAIKANLKEDSYLEAYVDQYLTELKKELKKPIEGSILESVLKRLIFDFILPGIDIKDIYYNSSGFRKRIWKASFFLDQFPEFRRDIFKGKYKDDLTQEFIHKLDYEEYHCFPEYNPHEILKELVLYCRYFSDILLGHLDCPDENILQELDKESLQFCIDGFREICCCCCCCCGDLQCFLRYCYGLAETLLRFLNDPDNENLQDVKKESLTTFNREAKRILEHLYRSSTKDFDYCDYTARKILKNTSKRDEFLSSRKSEKIRKRRLEQYLKERERLQKIVAKSKRRISRFEPFRKARLLFLSV